MSTLIRNVSTSTLECDVTNKSEIDNRISETITPGIIGRISTEIADLHNTITASPDSKIQTIKKATSFPMADIRAMIANSPDCQYLRVYNGFNSAGEYVTYMAPINAAFETYIEEDLSDNSIISSPCCHCNPCLTDVIING